MSVRKSAQMLALERQHGKDIEQVISETITARGSVPAAAEALEVNLNTLYGWMRYLRIQIRTVAEAPRAVA